MKNGPQKSRMLVRGRGGAEWSCAALSRASSKLQEENFRELLYFRRREHMSLLSASHPTALSTTCPSLPFPPGLHLSRALFLSSSLLPSLSLLTFSPSLSLSPLLSFFLHLSFSYLQSSRLMSSKVTFILQVLK